MSIRTNLTCTSFKGKKGMNILFWNKFVCCKRYIMLVALIRFSYSNTNFFIVIKIAVISEVGCIGINQKEFHLFRQFTTCILYVLFKTTQCFGASTTQTNK